MGFVSRNRRVLGFKSDNSQSKLTLDKLFTPNCLEESNRKPPHNASVSGEKLTGHAPGWAEKSASTLEEIHTQARNINIHSVAQHSNL